MFNVKQHVHKTGSTLHEAQEFLDALELNPALPDRLIRDEAGRPFEPVQIGLTQDGRTLPEQLILLLGDPVGGAEALIQANQSRLLARVQQRLYHRLAASLQGIPRRDFLLGLADEIRARQHTVERKLAEVEQSFRKQNEKVQKWQKQSRRAGGLVQTVIAWFLGGEVSLPEAVTAYNEREKLYLQLQAHTAAKETLTQFLDRIEYILEHLEALANQARRLQPEAARRVDALATPPIWYRPWNYKVHAPTVVKVLLERTEPGDLVARVLDRVQQGEDSADLAQAVRAVVQEEAAARLGSLSLVQLIELEAQAVALDEADPLVVVGQRLLEELTSHPTCQLLPAAQPREEVLQVTPDGQPVYRLAGLNTASYDAADRLAFIYVQGGVALSELRAFQETKDDFEWVQNQHNILVIEELAEDWDRRHAALSSSSAAPGKAGPAPDRAEMSEEPAR